jgi:WD40 repeat protein
VKLWDTGNGAGKDSRPSAEAKRNPLVAYRAIHDGFQDAQVPKFAGVTSVCMANDRLMTGGLDCTIKIFALRNPKEHMGGFVAEKFKSEVNAIAASRRTGLLACGDVCGAVRVPWAQTFLGHTDRIWGVCFSPDEKWLASASADCTVRLWNLERAGDRKIVDFVASHAKCLTISPDSSTLAAGMANGVVRLYNARTRQELLVLVPEDAAQEARISDDSPFSVTALTYSPDGQTLAVARRLRPVCLWDVARQRWRAVLRGSPRNSQGLALFSPDGRNLITGSTAEATRILQVWDPATATLLRELASPIDHPGVLALAPDGSRLVSSHGGLIQPWDWPAGLPLDPLSAGHGGGITSLALSPDGRTLVSGDSWGVVTFWDMAGQSSPVFHNSHSEAEVTGIQFASDGRTVLSAGLDGKLRFWNVATARELFAMQVAGIGPVACSGDGKILAAGKGGYGAHRGGIYLWTIEDQGEKETRVKNGK